MFSSIKWRLVIINFILVLIAMMIVGFVIMERLETQQLDSVSSSAMQDMKAIAGAGSAFTFPRWPEVTEQLQEAVDDWRLSADQTLYVISDREEPKILASTVSTNEMWKFKPALSYKNLSPTLILSAFEGKAGEEITKEEYEDYRYLHMAYPVIDELGKVNGVFYMVTSLESVDNTLAQTGLILTRATVVAVLVIIILGYIIAMGITVPIRDVTKKAEEMAGGDFDQRVEVKSNDEIGQLGAMFNHLTGELKANIGQINLERNKLDTIFHYMAEGVLAIDGRQHLMQANPFAMRVLNLKNSSVDKAVPELWDKLALPRDKEGNPIFTHGESRIELKRLHLNIKYAPFRNEWGYLDGIIVVLQDVTKEHRLDTMRKDFVANVSHELKTPITTVKSYVETMMELQMEPEQQGHFLKVIDDESDRMNRLVQDLLALSNLDYGQQPTEKEYLSANGLVEMALKRLAWFREEMGHEVTVIKGRPDLTVQGYRDSMERALVNLISNAFKYTEAGGRISIEVKEEDRHVAIIVEDNGIGIPEEDQERIFERFYRVEKGRSRSMGGTGLGLAIARESVRAYGGDILLSSELGVGTTMTLLLPKAEDDVMGS